jgi:hypothetical protein
MTLFARAAMPIVLGIGRVVAATTAKDNHPDPFSHTRFPASDHPS